MHLSPAIQRSIFWVLQPKSLLKSRNASIVDKNIYTQRDSKFGFTKFSRIRDVLDSTFRGLMKERVIYNTYYEYYDDFREAVLGFFAVLSTVAIGSILGQALRSRVRDKFRAIGAPATNF